MYIFIDEAGIFIDPAQTKKHNVSMIGALVIPEQYYSQIMQCMKEIKEEWGYEGEVKGSKLKESQVAQLVTMLLEYNVLYVVVACETALLTPLALKWHKNNFARHILSNISKFHHPNMVNQIMEMSFAIEKFSNQLYVQYILMLDLIVRIHQYSTLYYAQCLPAELGSFHWIIDAKEKNGMTPVELWWKEILNPCLQGMSIKEPLIFLEGADYSFYEKYNTPYGSDINKIMEGLNFQSSSAHDGLQLVDVLTTVLRKALNNKFEYHGWQDIGKLMKKFRKEEIIPFLSFGMVPTSLMNVRYVHVTKELSKFAQPLILHH